MIVDLFAGGGGASTGIEAATGRIVDIAINHDPVALAVHKANHPGTIHLEADIWEVRPEEAVKGRKVELLWASPDCTHFSAAKGGKPRKQGIRSLAWAVVRWAKEVRPSVICLENVAEFQTWGPLDTAGFPRADQKGETFKRWKRELERLGYVVDHRVLDASKFGAPTKRRRLFLVARCDGLPISWPAETHGPGLAPLHTAAECINWDLPCPSIFERSKPLAEKTLWRIAQGIRRFILENPAPFIVGDVAPTMVQTGYGERPGQRPRYLNLHEPIGTLMAKGQKHALVSAFLAKHFGGVVGTDIRGQVSTTTTRDHHALAAVALAKFRGTHPSQPGSGSVEAPIPTISAGGIHVAEVRAFLTAYYGTDGGGQAATEPMRTLTAKHRLGLVKVLGVDYQIIDIGMRMLEPEELLKAQFGRFSPSYDLSLARTKSDKVRLIGNSVCPEVAEALVAANLPGFARAAA